MYKLAAIVRREDIKSSPIPIVVISGKVAITARGDSSVVGNASDVTAVLPVKDGGKI